MKTDTYPEGHLRHSTAKYLAHFHCERNHEGIGNERIDGQPSVGFGEVRSADRLDGMLRYYHRAA